VARIGFVGLGVMGSRVVTRLLEAGHRVAGYTRAPAKALPLVPRVLLAERAGIERGVAVDAMLSSVIASPMLYDVLAHMAGLEEVRS
jgi:3-hydroxyisobutyrate dehydrogenase-like beta-hydroxyacid dehydrogenase